MSVTSSTVFLAVLLGLTVALGVVVLTLEQPDRLGRFPRTRFAAVATLGLSTVAIIGVVIVQDRHSSHAGSSSLPANAISLATVLHAVAASDDIRTVPDNLIPPLSQVPTVPNLGFPPTSTGCVPGYEQSAVPSCTFGDRTGGRTMVLYGDSHAGMWFRALDDIATRAHWKLIVLFKPACLADPLPTHLSAATGVWVACNRWHRFAIARINRLDPDLLVVTQSVSQTPNGVDYTPTQWRSGLRDLLRQVIAHRTVVLGDIPASRGPTCVAQHADDVQVCSPSATKAETVTYVRAERQAAVSVGDRYVDVIPWFCAKTCSPIIGRYDVYFDQSHVSVGYSRYLEGVLAQKLDL